jgi:hypothetical protein
MCPDGVCLAAKEEVGIELVCLDGDIAVDNVLLFDCMVTDG